MKAPQTVYDVLVMLADYHHRRSEKYRQLASASVDPRADILLEHLVVLETHASKAIRSEMEQLSPEHATYLISGPTLSVETAHAAECRCDDEPGFHDALACALTSDQRLGELLDRIAGCSAAPSVAGLADRLRDLENTKDRQIANFTRED